MESSFIVAALAASALVAAPAITPAAAKDAKHSSMRKHMSHKHMHKHSGRMSHRDDYRNSNAAYRDTWNRPMNTGFAPLDVTGNIVGGAIGTAGAIAGTAVGTAGAIAAAPFGAGPYAAGSYGPRGPDYAYGYGYGYNDPYRYDGTALQYSPSYAARNGFVCQPGTWFKNSAGRMQICQ